MRLASKKHWSLALALVAFLVLVAVKATERADKQRIGTDFHVFWQAGYDFTHGLPLYQQLPGARHFIYPPFAAQVFQVLGIFPLKTAAWLFYVGSVVLIFVAAKVSHLGILPQGKLEKDRRVANMVKTMDEAGFGNCTVTGSCEAVCPKEIPLSFIARMNRNYAVALLKGK